METSLFSLRERCLIERNKTTTIGSQ